MIRKDKLTHDTYLFEMEFPNKEWTSGLWPAGHIFFHQKINGKTVTRKYSSISSNVHKGSMLFAIKIYRHSEEFPGGGLFT